MSAPRVVVSLDQARRLVRGFTAGGTPEQIEAIASRMVERGECVLHAAAAIVGAACWCAACRPDIKRLA